MQKIIVADTSCLILLSKIDRLKLLQTLFREITITSIIAEEIGDILPQFILTEDPLDKNYQKILEGFLDRGEASAIALAIEKEDCLLIMDETKGRREAKRMNIKITGTLGILILAKEKGIIDSVSEILDLISKTDFRIDESLIIETRRKCGE